jgi:4-diphosphocytidyl-2-C-methyl-D-erythritol kinase
VVGRDDLESLRHVSGHLSPMPIKVHSFAKINIGLVIGPPGMRADHFHELRTVYQTIALYDRLTIEVGRAKKTSIEIVCANADVPRDSSNTCFKAAAGVLAALKLSAKLRIEIEKRLPVQGGLGAASGNAAATILGVERAIAAKKLSKKHLSAPERLRIATEVGSDVPLFLVGGTVAGVGRGEQVFPLPDSPELNLVIAMPKVKVATPKAFGDWDALFRDKKSYAMFERVDQERPELTVERQSVKLNTFSNELSAWLSGYFSAASGVPARGGNRAEALLLDLVRTGIENDFERVVFPQFPELRDIKRQLEREGSKYASLSGSGSAVYGLFSSRMAAVRAAKRLHAKGIPAKATKFLSRTRYWSAVRV